MEEGSKFREWTEQETESGEYPGSEVRGNLQQDTPAGSGHDSAVFVQDSEAFTQASSPAQLDGEIRRISRFHALTLCRITLSALLVGFELIRGFYGFRVSPAIYILLFCNVVPWLLEELSSSRRDIKKGKRLMDPRAAAPWNSASIQLGTEKTPFNSFAVREAEPETQTRAQHPVLPYLRKHYRYSAQRYKAGSISYLATCLLLVLWQVNNGNPQYPFAWLYNAPAIFLAVITMLRILAPPVLTWRIKRQLLSGGIKEIS